jgi:5'-3' exonuclease
MNKRHLALFEEIKNQLEHLEEEPQTADTRILVVDGLNTFIRCFAAVPVMNDDGLHIGGISGFLRSIGYAIEVTQPTRVIVVFDGKGGSVRRKKLFPEYKERRTPDVRLNRSEVFSDKTHEEKMLRHELFRVADYLGHLPVVMLALENVEADDVIAYITTNVLSESKVTIMSSDKDFLQLCSDRVEVWSPTKKKIYTAQVVKDEYGVPPQNFCLFRAISGRGDKSDNIGGIKGFGDKTIIKKLPMLTEDRKVEVSEVIDAAKALVNHPKESDTLLERLYDGRDIVERNVKLMQLGNVDISASTKSKVLERVRQPIPVMNKFEIMKMVFQDKLWAGIPNMELWLRTHWSTIDRFAQLTHKKEST